MKTICTFAAILVMAVAPRSSHGQANVESNVVYGMYSGLALLMDVHHPASPNGIGIVLIQGSGFHQPTSLDADHLKDSAQRGRLASNELLESGYTLFSINHRAAPRFRYPAAVEDAQRAVRFIRHYAARYGIDRDRVGVLGASSGGYLASMLGVLDGDEARDDLSAVNRESSKVQAVVAWYSPTDLVEFGPSGTHASFVGTRWSPDPESEEARQYAEASPAYYVTRDDPPFMLMHGDADGVVPISQSENFEQKLSQAGVAVELIRIPGGGHGERNLGVPNAPDYAGSAVAWFDRHLRDIR